MPKNSPLFTIFTGLYNSQNIVNRVFESIESQTFRDFEWIVIDDCSTDNSVSIMEQFIKKNSDLNIKFIKHSENQGVNASRKEALFLATGKYFISWDHDDIQLENQLEVLRQLWEENDTSQIANIFSKMTDQEGKILGHDFPSELYISDYINLHNDYLVGNKKKGIVIEHHVCVKVEKLKEVISFFERNADLGKKDNFQLADLWGTIAYLGYKTLCTNQVLRKKFVFEEGRQSLSNSPRNKNPERIYTHKLLWVNYWESKLHKKSMKWIIRNHVAVAMYGLMANKTLKAIINDTIYISSKILILITFIPSYYLAKKFE